LVIFTVEYEETCHVFLVGGTTADFKSIDKRRSAEINLDVLEHVPFTCHPGQIGLGNSDSISFRSAGTDESGARRAIDTTLGGGGYKGRIRYSQRIGEQRHQVFVRTIINKSGTGFGGRPYHDGSCGSKSSCGCWGSSGCWGSCCAAQSFVATGTFAKVSNLEILTGTSLALTGRHASEAFLD
jgi:hypothetical protein